MKQRLLIRSWKVIRNAVALGLALVVVVLMLAE